MKRKVLFMTLAMTVVLTACGGNADKAASSNADANVSEDAGTAADDGAESTDDAAESTDDAAESTDAADDVQAATADEAGVGAADTEAEAEAEGDGEAASGKYAKGSVSETGWESEFFGLRYTAPEGMGMSTEEELNGLMGLGQEVLSDDFSELQLKYAELTSVYEMMSVADDQTTNVVVTVEKLMGKMDASQYVSALEQGLSQVSAISYTLISDDETVKIGNGDYIKVSYQAESSGVSMYQDYYVRVVDDRAIALTLTYIDESARDNVLNAFTAY